jgi:energy-coupling factor transporter ATP-binding protein EcfA2
MSDPIVNLSPVYGSEVRVLVSRADGPVEPIPATPVPGGYIRSRLAAPAARASRDLVTLSSGVPPDPLGSDVREVPAHWYWPRALAHRGLATGVLLGIDRSDLRPEFRLRAERVVLKAHFNRYRGAPLPPYILAALRQRVEVAPEEDFANWLDGALLAMSAAPKVEDAVRTRTGYRRRALRLGAQGTWSERTVALAEFLTDLFLLHRAAGADIETARALAPKFGGSVSRAMAHLDAGRALAVERVLPLLVRPAFGPEDIPDADERVRLVAFARTRPVRRQSILETDAVPEKPPASAGAAPAPPAVAPATPPTPPAGRLAPPPEASARDSFRRILSSLEQRILGAASEQLRRQLSLFGTAHVHAGRGTTLLLAGPTGSGKTHAARALAGAIGHPFLQVDSSDLTATGWMGGSIAEFLESLDRLMRDSGLPGVLILDEVDKVRANRSASGNSEEAKLNLQQSLLGLLAGQPVTLPSGRDQIDTSKLLIIGTGAFSDRFIDRPPTVEDLVQWGWIREFAARWRDRLCVPAPDRSQCMDLLRRSDESVARRLGPLASALGMGLTVSEATLAFVTDWWLRTGTDFRTVAGLVVTAARERLIAALERDDSDPIVLAPDDIRLPPVSRRDDPGADPPWDPGDRVKWS